MCCSKSGRGRDPNTVGWQVVDSAVCFALQGQVIGWGWDAVGAQGSTGRNLMKHMKFVSGTERKDSRNL